jgi:hypothetical protein
MAKKRRGFKTRTIVRYAGRARGIGRRISRSGATSPIGAYIGGQILGRLEASGTLARLPNIVGTDPVMNAGIVGYAAQRFLKIKNRWLHDATIAALAVGGYRNGVAGKLLGDTGGVLG